MRHQAVGVLWINITSKLDTYEEGGEDAVAPTTVKSLLQWIPVTGL